MYAKSYRRMRDIKLPDINDHIAADEEALRLREEYLDSRMLNSTDALAQEVTQKLINQLHESVPWLLPEVI